MAVSLMVLIQPSTTRHNGDRLLRDVVSTCPLRTRLDYDRCSRRGERVIFETRTIFNFPGNSDSCGSIGRFDTARLPECEEPGNVELATPTTRRGELQFRSWRQGQLIGRSLNLTGRLLERGSKKRREETRILPPCSFTRPPNKRA